MSVEEKRPPRFWVAIVTVALLLLASILVVVVVLSTRLRQPERQIVIQQVPVEKVAPAREVADAPPPVSRSRSAATPSRPEARPRSQPAHVVTQPVKVIEKQVKVVEKEVRIVEKPVRVTSGPASHRLPVTESSNRGSQAAADTAKFQETGLPNQLTYAGKMWNASELVRGLPADLVTADENHRVSDRTVYHEKDAEAPFPHVYLKVAGQTDQYVRYVPTSS